MSGAEERKILLVDDDQTLLEYLSKRLQRDGYYVRASFSGEDALKVVVDEDFDVAVVDLKMPGMDGVETQRRLQEVLPRLQCVVLTAYGSVESALKSGQLGAFDYLFKPIDYDSLVTAIQGALSRKRNQERDLREQEDKAASGSSSSGGGIRRIWRALRRAYGVPAQ